LRRLGINQFRVGCKNTFGMKATPLSRLQETLLGHTTSYLK
jgi:hypothetical protein